MSSVKQKYILFQYILVLYMYINMSCFPDIINMSKSNINFINYIIFYVKELVNSNDKYQEIV